MLLAAAAVLATACIVAPVMAQEPADPGAGVYPLRTIDPTADGFSDLAPLAELVADSRVVVLGELSHGFGDSFDARIRITKFLHQEMGFDVLLFETPFFLSRKMNAALSGSGPIEEAVDVAMFPIWAHSEQMMELFRYVRRSKAGPRPLDLFGVDAQLISYAGEDSLLADSFKEVLSIDTDPAVQEIARGLEQLIYDLNPRSGVSYDGEWFRDARILISDTRYLFAAPGAELRASLSPADLAWWERMVVSLDRLVEDRAVRAIAPPFRGDFEAYGRHPAVHAGQNRRDQAMAGNIAWMANEFRPGSRIIVWMANSHAEEAPGPLIEGDDFRTVRQHTTGTYLEGIVGPDEVFTVLHSAYRGAHAGSFVFRDGQYIWSERELSAAPVGTLEHALHEAGVESAIVDLAARNSHNAHLRDVLDRDVALPLHAYGDALLFLDEDGPSRPRPGAPIRFEDADD